MSADPVWFASPSSAPSPLAVRPRLASWMAAEDPDQRALGAFLDHVEELARPRLDVVDGPLAVGLHVRLDDHLNLLRDRDLDNYALPVVTRLARASGRLATSVHVTKDQRTPSSLRVERAEPAAAPAVLRTITTSASAESSAYKEQVRDRLADVDVLPAGPVWLQLSFVVNPRRTWTNLWKPTIDALGALLGSSSTREWQPEDGRITTLEMHHSVDASLGQEVVIAVVASPAGVPV